MNKHELIISGNHLELTSRMKEMVESKTAKLFHHEVRIQRIRVELGVDDITPNQKEYWAKGHIEINRKPLIVKEKDGELYRALDQMVIKLDRMLRRRSRLRVAKRKLKQEIDIPAEIPKAQTAA
ncbi:MAG: ribosome-associated translation inhibitor RaiA [Puniceicoccaceae bacterium]